jgi:hypothetical protein
MKAKGILFFSSFHAVSLFSWVSGYYCFKVPHIFDAINVIVV